MEGSAICTIRFNHRKLHGVIYRIYLKLARDYKVVTLIETAKGLFQVKYYFLFFFAHWTITFISVTGKCLLQTRLFIFRFGEIIYTKVCYNVVSLKYHRWRYVLIVQDECRHSTRRRLGWDDVSWYTATPIISNVVKYGTTGSYIPYFTATVMWISLIGFFDRSSVCFFYKETFLWEWDT